MKTETQEKFDRIIKESFIEILKPLGFKKKANNFYLPLDKIGHIINIQKSYYSTKDDIRFTINVGIFSPEYWLARFNYSNKDVPAFPTEPECMIRERIGCMRGLPDTWYNITTTTDVEELIVEMKYNISSFILPFLEKLNTEQKLINELETSEHTLLHTAAKMTFFAELKLLDKARTEYRKISKENYNQYQIARLKEYAEKQGLI
ncbi:MULTISPECIES: DUF4304 domain-containing protein [Sphingobacterium]|uniref:DUF4304 domain-containing protein n=1 Tax=Sphingobacterium athyrii TaxID=2152717 RepID=A0A363NTY5_9SPHI|nr:MULTISPECIES: DUF4304 domain-containing protein [Sphingobacterium]PUV24111.1 hypothetical protein DCO56_12125 [Sphingobacterium athyrii]QIH34127.1 DUF4304 domain-containing protein [Sphingobacterium sp. DR205]